MIYSHACAYAIRAMSRLAALEPEGYVLLDHICEGTDLPKDFLAKVFQQLVRHGLLISAKGRGGGFALSRSASRITLYEIVAAIDGVEGLNRCVVGMGQCNESQPCPQHEPWAAVRKQLRDFMLKTTLANMGKTLERKLELLGQPIQRQERKSRPIRI
jgi:Rrf2 family protein